MHVHRGNREGCRKECAVLDTALKFGLDSRARWPDRRRRVDIAGKGVRVGELRERIHGQTLAMHRDVEDEQSQLVGGNGDARDGDGYKVRPSARSALSHLGEHVPRRFRRDTYTQ